MSCSNTRRRSFHLSTDSSRCKRCRSSSSPCKRFPSSSNRSRSRHPPRSSTCSSTRRKHTRRSSSSRVMASRRSLFRHRPSDSCTLRPRSSPPRRLWCSHTSGTRSRRRSSRCCRTTPNPDPRTRSRGRSPRCMRCRSLGVRTGCTIGRSRCTPSCSSSRLHKIHSRTGSPRSTFVPAPSCRRRLRTRNLKRSPRRPRNSPCMRSRRKRTAHSLLWSPCCRFPSRRSFACSIVLSRHTTEQRTSFHLCTSGTHPRRHTNRSFRTLRRPGPRIRPRGRSSPRGRCMSRRSSSCCTRGMNPSSPCCSRRRPRKRRLRTRFRSCRPGPASSCRCPTRSHIRSRIANR